MADKSNSPIHNLNNNVVEAFDCTKMHVTGKKVVTYMSQFGYTGRTYRAVLLQINEFDSYSNLHTHLQNGTALGMFYDKLK